MTNDRHITGFRFTPTVDAANLVKSNASYFRLQKCCEEMSTLRIGNDMDYEQDVNVRI